MSVPQSCIYKAVNLTNGDKFVLPPGAEVVGISDVTKVTSECDIPAVEDVNCYVGIVAVAAEDGNQGQYYEQGIINIVGVRFNGTTYNFGTPYTTYDPGYINNFNNMADEIKSLVPGIVAVVTGTASDFYRGTLNYVLIKTITSIAENLEIIGNTSAPTGYTNTTEVRWPFKLRQTMVDEGYVNVPDCPGSVSS